MVPQRGWGPQLEGVGEVTGSRQGNGHDELGISFSGQGKWGGKGKFSSHGNSKCKVVKACRREK